jgi:diguanylate cyclase (GGDEF)-like protein
VLNAGDAAMLLGSSVFAIGGTLGLLWIGIDRANASLVKLATLDGLTGLARREVVIDHVNREIARCQRSGGQFALAMFDLDRFKVLNDRLGHQVGDAALREVCRALKKSTRVYDQLGRYGGEEILLLLPGATPQQGLAVCERARLAVEATVIRCEKGEARVTVSAGVAVYPRDGASCEALLKRADAALYAAKQAGRNRVLMAS